jgi:hypothetical protein
MECQIELLRESIIADAMQAIVRLINNIKQTHLCMVPINNEDDGFRQFRPSFPFACKHALHLIVCM